MSASAPVRQQYSAILKTILFILVVPCTVVVWLPWRLGLLNWYLSRGVPVRIAGVVLLLTGCLIALHTAFSFAWTGRGTPAPIDAPRTLVTGGLYRYCRNPMYWGVLLSLIGESLAWGTSLRANIAYGAAFLISVNLFIRFYEEPALTRKFGAEYREYCRNVARWLPRLPHV
jgi:protein-S-isoprenylcysteine O-methyltransferase Ste14